MVEIGLTDLQQSGGAMALPAPSDDRPDVGVHLFGICKILKDLISAIYFPKLRNLSGGETMIFV